MQILGKIWLVILIIGMLYCFYVLYKLTIETYKLHQNAMRFKQVYKYRTNLINRIGADTYKKIASFDDMMTSNKPLKDKYWVNFEKDKDNNLPIVNHITENKAFAGNTLKADYFFNQFDASHNHIHDSPLRNSETYKVKPVNRINVYDDSLFCKNNTTTKTDTNYNLKIQIEEHKQLLI